jgi:hypothetical protein
LKDIAMGFLIVAGMLTILFVVEITAGWLLVES